ncbi:MAG: YbaK/EbsC family protein [Gammaproteobacteria bacterium]
MSMAQTLQEYLEWEEVPYDVITHPYTCSSLETARITRIPAQQLAKCVALGDGFGYLMAIVPADCNVDIDYVGHALRRNLSLASEAELSDLFYDCVPGSIPPLCEAYGFDSIVDRQLWNATDIYFTAGDHEALLHIDGKSFRQLMSAAALGDICLPLRYTH